MRNGWLHQKGGRIRICLRVARLQQSAKTPERRDERRGVEIIVEEVAVCVERHRRTRVTEHPLHCFDVGACIELPSLSL
jgi:hypothetical protein